MLDRFCQCTFLAWTAFASVPDSLGIAEVEHRGTNDPTYRVTRWTTDQGLPQNRISCLKQTRDGYLWLGTWFGLARFDGVRFTVFDKFNTPELVNDAINGLAEDTDGTLWIATADGLVGYRDHQFRRLTTADGLPDQKVWRLAACSSGGVWLQARDFVTRLEGGKFSQVRRVPYSENNEIRALQEGVDGSLHIVRMQNWLTLSPNGAELSTNDVVNASGVAWLTGLSAKQAGRFWVGTQHGLQCWQQGVCKPAGEDQIGSRGVDFIYEDRATNLWVNVKSAGLYRGDSSHLTAVDLEDRAASASTLCIEEDREGNLWLGTEQGLVQLQMRRVRAYATREGLANDTVWSVCESADGMIWTATDRGLSRIQNEKVVPLERSEPTLNLPDRCVWPARNGSIWFAKPEMGVYESGDRFVQRIPASDLPSPNIFALLKDRLERLWIGTGKGVAVWKDGDFAAVYTNWAGQSGYDVRCILEDRAETFWFGTQGQGLTRLRDGEFEVFTERDGLSNNRVWCIHEDGNGVLWLGTENGLNRFVPPAAPSPPLRPGERVSAGRERGRFFSFTRKDGLLENSINWILEDDFGYLWLSGLRGIYRVKREQLNAVAEGRASEVQVATFGTTDGMESSETNGEGQPAGWKARDGRLWFPTTRGVVVIDPKTIEVSEVPPPVVIERVKADDEVIFGDGAARSNRKSEIGNPKLKLPPGRAQVMEISYTANTFVDSTRARFRYRLIGRDAGWRDITTERVAHYTNLRPGKYRFEVTAVNHHGVWSTATAGFAFSLAPHISETWPFYSVCGALVLSTGFALHLRRVGRLRRFQQLEQQRALHEERARIAKDLHDDLGANLTGLALQLDVMRSQGPDADARQNQLATLARRTRGLVDNMREVVWAMNPQNDNVESLASFLGQYTENYLAAAGVRCRLELPSRATTRALSSNARHQLFLVVKEALHNIVRHARANEVQLRLDQQNGELRLTIADDGCGLPPVEARLPGHGLDNMEKRVTALGGEFTAARGGDGGTRLSIRLLLGGAVSGVVREE